MKLVVGLGNPGKEYKNTRHNMGFMIIDEYLGKVAWKQKMETYYYQDEDTIFIKPLTYMNLSGLAVKRIIDFYKIDIQDILVIQDDLDLEFGSYRIKRNSSSGGHNGIKSIIKELGSQEFGRLKIGIGKDTKMPIDKYVLSKFTKEELELLNNNMDKFLMIIKNFVNHDLDYIIKQNC